MKANEEPETYPMQFRDKIDEYLWKEHHIIGGCCSSIEEMKYSVAREVAEKLTDVFIEKAENFLEMLGYGFTITDNITHTNYDKEQLIDDFRNYMKGE